MKSIKKDYKIWIISIFLAFTALGCNEYLKETNPSEVTTDFLYTTVDGLQSAVNGLYTIERNIITDDYGQSSEFANIIGDCGTDIDFDQSSAADLARYRTDIDLTTQATVRDWWNMWYKIIERSNSIISFGEKAEIDQNLKMVILRDAYIYRAYAYFWLVRKFDNIWLNTEPTTFQNTDGRTFEVANQADVYTQIISDLDKSIQYYGTDWTIVPGKFNQGVARLLRADVALWKQDWQTAASQTNEIITKGPFSLESPESVFTKDGRNNTKEAMYVIQFDQFAPGGGTLHRLPLIFTAQYRSVPGCIMASEFGGYGWARVFPNPYLISLYDSKNDKRWNNWWQHYYIYNDPNYDFSKLKYHFGDTLKYKDNSSLTGDNYFRRANISCKKYFDWTQQGPTITTHYNNIYMFRYPHVLLIAAEANMRLGDNPKALSYINQIRQSRILSTATNQLFTTINEDLLLDEYAREMAFEGQRWFMLKRLNKLVERVRLYGGIKEFRTAPSPNPLYYSARTNIQSYHVRWPIPQSARDAMGGFPQNEGYNQ